MICPKCKAVTEGAVVFCPECGANMMESVSDSAEEIQGEVKESAEVAYEETTEKSDIVAETVAVTEEKVEDKPGEVEEEIVKNADSAPENIVSESDSRVASTAAVAAPAAPIAIPVAPSKKEKKQKKIKPVENVDVPKAYKPFSTIGAFGYLLLTGIPVVGLISLLIFAFGGKNKNRKAMSRAILIFCLIGIIISIGVSLIMYFAFRDLIADIIDAESVEEIIELTLEELDYRFG